MKNKYIAAILLGIMILGTGCQIKETSTGIPSPEPPAIEDIKEEDEELVSDKVILSSAEHDKGIFSFVVENKLTSGTLYYPNTFVILSAIDNDLWEFTDFTNELMFTAEVKLVNAGKTETVSVDLNPIIDKFEKGKTYRIARNLILDGTETVYESRITFDISEAGVFENISAEVIELIPPELPEIEGTEPGAVNEAPED